MEQSLMGRGGLREVLLRWKFTPYSHGGKTPRTGHPGSVDKKSTRRGTLPGVRHGEGHVEGGSQSRSLGWSTYPRVTVAASPALDPAGIPSGLRCRSQPHWSPQGVICFQAFRLPPTHTCLFLRGKLSILFFNLYFL